MASSWSPAERSIVEGSSSRRTCEILPHGDIGVIVDEAVRGRVPPAWFWALPGIDRIRAFDLSQLPSPPVARLLGIRAGHVGPGSGTWVMPATGWSLITSGELEISMLAEAAVTGVAMTT